MKLKASVHDFLSGKRDSVLSRTGSVLLITLILINVLSLVVQTVQPFYLVHQALFDGFDRFILLIFSLEYLLRAYTITEDVRYARPLAGRLRYLVTPLALVDLLAVLPFWLSLLLPGRFALELLTILRVFRLLKIMRYSRTMQTMVHIVVSRKDELLVSLSFMIGILVLASTLMFYVESRAQPELFSSIPATMWWGITTLTTVGYGDMYPITPLGRLLAAIMAVLGVAMFALPAGIIGSAFVEIMQQRNAEEATVCPHCGALQPEHDNLPQR